jgi:AraC-like DNA-binding protein
VQGSDVHARTLCRRTRAIDDARRQHRDIARHGNIGTMSNRTVLSALVRNVLDAAGSLGADVPKIIAEAGIDPAALDDPDGRIPVELDLRVWEILTRRADGFAIGARLGIASLGIVGYAMAHGRTVADALAWQQRYGAIVHPGLLPRIERRRAGAAELLVFVRDVVPAFARLREPVYAQVAAIQAVLQALSGLDVSPTSVALPLPRPENAHAIESLARCAVAWSSARLEVAFDAAVLDAPLPRSDPRLFGYLARHADAVLAALPADSTWAERVRREIAPLLVTGEPRLATVAKRLAVSPRTLHRRLHAEGTRFATLVDAARRERALLLLEDRTLSASEIAFLLGYAEPAAFFRAFRRWSGVTPQVYRRARLTTSR